MQATRGKVPAASMSTAADGQSPTDNRRQSPLADIKEVGSSLRTGQHTDESTHCTCLRPLLSLLRQLQKQVSI